jgi:hypothetical protein
LWPEELGDMEKLPEDYVFTCNLVHLACRDPKVVPVPRIDRGAAERDLAKP